LGTAASRVSSELQPTGMSSGEYSRPQVLRGWCGPGRGAERERKRKEVSSLFGPKDKTRKRTRKESETRGRKQQEIVISLDSKTNMTPTRKTLATIVVVWTETEEFAFYAKILNVVVFDVT